jgi:hypothetical protein
MSQDIITNTLDLHTFQYALKANERGRCRLFQEALLV